MKVKYSAILSVNEALKAVVHDGSMLRYVHKQTEAVCLKAVEQNAYALRYVLDLDLFTRIAAKLSIEIEL